MPEALVKKTEAIPPPGRGLRPVGRQAKGVKAAVADGAAASWAAAGKEPPAAVGEKVKRYEEEQKEISEKTHHPAAPTAAGRSVEWGMPSPSSRRLRRAALALAAAALSGGSLFLGAGLHPIAWLVWLAPLPVLWAAPRLGGWTAAGAAALAWAAGASSEVGYLTTVHLPVPMIALAILAPALVFGAGIALARAFAVRGAALRAALACRSSGPRGSSSRRTR